MKTTRQKITIIGFGRFGKVLYRVLKDDFEITILTRKTQQKNISITHDLKKAYISDVVFYAVPIVEFENIIRQHKKYFKPTHLLIDVLSVKMHPKKIFEKYIKDTKTQVLLTHPMFGPDSSNDGFTNLPIIIDRFKTTDKTYQFWKTYFQKKKLRVIEMTAEKHDRLAAVSQGVTHFIGRLLDECDLKPTPIDSLGTEKLLFVILLEKS